MHEQPALDHRPSADVDRAAVLLHGRRRPPGDMRDLAGRLGLLDWRCVFPVADEASWYPRGFMEPTDVNATALEAAVARLAAEVDRLRAEGFGERILVGGFSQGACVVCEYLARDPGPHLAALVLRGGRLGPAGATYEPAPGLDGLPVLLTGGDADPWVPPARVRETADWLVASGANVRLEIVRSAAHLVDHGDAEAAREFLSRYDVPTGSA